MISEQSRLFEAHPDWAIGVPGRPRTESRQQLVLDMSRPEIVDHLFGVLSEVLASAPISYIKWDMNRTITEPFSTALPAERQGEFFHRYILGVYDLYARLTAAFPEILFESCAGGGGRFDPGCSPTRRRRGPATTPTPSSACAIQWGTSLAYPLSSMGAHVAAVPNHQTSRITPIATRAAVAFFGVLGYELDPTTPWRRRPARHRRPDRLLQDPSRPLPARAVRAPAQPVRGRRQPDRLDGRRARRVDRRSSATTRSSTGRCPPPTGCGCAGWIPTTVYRVSGWPDVARPAGPRQRRGARRRRADARRPVARCRPPRRRRSGATSRPGCSSSRRSNGADELALRGAPQSPIYGSVTSPPDRSGPYSSPRDGAHAPRGDDAQRRLACASEKWP